MDVDSAKEKYALSAEELADLLKMSGNDQAEVRMDDSEEDAPRESQVLVNEMLGTLLVASADEFLKWLEKNSTDIYSSAEDDEQVVDALVLGYRFGIGLGSGACANDLGALYYLGRLVEQDYAKAAELYELAIDMGCCQSIVNLGYVYEYGRLGEPDYRKAYECYSLAAALDENFEAVYKLGDMFDRGRGVETDKKKAFLLWRRSLNMAKGLVQVAQPAFRIAKMLIDPDCEEFGAKFDPLHALHLFQQAEVGLRVDIDDGQTYYAERLEETVEGQAQARELLDAQTVVLTSNGA